jgi:hypothetical protein
MSARKNLMKIHQILFFPWQSWSLNSGPHGCWQVIYHFCQPPKSFFYSYSFIPVFKCQKRNYQHYTGYLQLLNLNDAGYQVHMVCMEEARAP